MYVKALKYNNIHLITTLVLTDLKLIDIFFFTDEFCNHSWQCR